MWGKNINIHSSRLIITALIFMAISGCATSPGGYWPYYGNMGYQSGYSYPGQGHIVTIVMVIIQAFNNLMAVVIMMIGIGVVTEEEVTAGIVSIAIMISACTRD